MLMNEGCVPCVHRLLVPSFRLADGAVYAQQRYKMAGKMPPTCPTVSCLVSCACDELYLTKSYSGGNIRWDVKHCQISSRWTRTELSLISLGLLEKSSNASTETWMEPSIRFEKIKPFHALEALVPIWQLVVGRCDHCITKRGKESLLAIRQKSSEAAVFGLCSLRSVEQNLVKWLARQCLVVVSKV